MNGRDLKSLRLVALLIVTIAYAYWSVLISPVRTEAARLMGQLEMSEEQIRLMSAELKRLRIEEMAAQGEAEATAWARQLLDEVPSNYLVSCPDILSQLLKGRDVQNPRVTVQMLLPLRGGPEYMISRWNLKLPEARAFQMGELLADLENHFPMGQLDSLTLTANAATGTINGEFVFDIVVRP